jgi:putative peptide zinc metalloprotease protein
MLNPLESSSWYRVAKLKPRLRAHVRLHAHTYRGQRWYVLQDPATGQCQRISSSAYALVGRMDGERCLDDIFRLTLAALGEAAPTQDEALRVLGSLHRADALQSDVPPDVAELFARSQRAPARALGQLLNPVTIRIPLFDPDRWLARWESWVSPLLTYSAAVAATVILAVTAVFGALNVRALAADAGSLLGDPRSWLALIVAYVVLKVLHELGHAFSARSFGAEVHEMGITLLFFVPIPYVDASGSAAFPEKGRRIAVSMAGVAVEGVAAGLGLIAWWLLEPGFMKALCAQLFFLGTLSTLAFNGNPLLRYDAYFALSDALEIPNLYERSRGYLRGWLERRLLGLEDVREVVQAEGEEAWLVAYGLASSAYRVVLAFVIAWMVAEVVPGAGIALGALWIILQLVMPLVSGALFLVQSPRLSGRRSRTLIAVGGAALCLAAAALFVPVPHRSLAEGVVWLPEHAQLRAGTDGFVRGWLIQPGAPVSQGQPVLQLDEPLADARVRVLAARRDTLRRSRQGAGLDRMLVAEIDGELTTLEEELQVARDRLGEVVLRSASDGVLLSAAGGDLPGRFVRQGDALGYVVERRRPTVRVALDQEQIARVREHTSSVALMLGSPRAPVRWGRIIREVPSASHRVPSAVLGAQGGGSWPIDPSDPDGLRTNEPVFWVDVELDRESSPRVGDRVYVCFEHEKKPLGMQVAVALRSLLLRRVGV